MNCLATSFTQRKCDQDGISTIHQQSRPVRACLNPTQAEEHRNDSLFPVCNLVSRELLVAHPRHWGLCWLYYALIFGHVNIKAKQPPTEDAHRPEGILE